MTVWLEPQLGEKVVEISTGTGYQAAIQAELGELRFIPLRLFPTWSKIPRPRSCLNEGSEKGFDSIVTGASQKGTWGRLLNIPVEGKMVDGCEGLNVGEQVRVQWIDTNIE